MDESNQFEGACRREFFRLRYPLSSRPTLLIRSRTFLVAELSEKGLRLADQRGGPQFAVEPGQQISGRINLPSGDVEITGKVLRRDRQEVIVADVEGISFQKLLEEQRRLIKAYPMIFRIGDD